MVLITVLDLNKTLFNATNRVDHEANLILNPGGKVLSGKYALDTIRKITIDGAVVRAMDIIFKIEFTM